MKKIGIIIADETEYRPFVKAVSSLTECRQEKRYGNDSVTFSLFGAEMTAVWSGVGKVNAAMAAAFLISSGVESIWNIGLSGAVSGVHRGDVVIGSSFVEADFDLSPLGYPKGQKPQPVSHYPCDPSLLALCRQTLPHAKAGDLASGDFFLTDEKRKQEYAQLFHMTAFDMETGAIAAVCYKGELPFVSLRKMSDDASDTAAGAYREMASLEEQDLAQDLLAVLQKFCADKTQHDGM